MRLVFCGFMGAGKSKLGRLCARQLGLDHHDLDALIVESVGMPIPQYFAEAGEAAFRQIEAVEFDRILPSDHRILSIGGGALRSVEQVDSLKTDNLMVWIDVPLDTVFDRVIGDPRRPLANAGPDPDTSKAALTALFERRRPLYERAQLHFRPQTEWTPDESAHRLTDLIRRHGHPH